MPALHATESAPATLGGTTMGTRWSVRLSMAPQTDLHRLHHGIQACLDTVVAQMSHWEPGSDLSRFNRAGAGHWQPLPEAFHEVMRAALRVAAETAGAFDPTVAPLVSAWGFGPGGTPRVPEPAALAAARRQVDWRRLVLDSGRARLRQPGGAALDLSGIAKGFAVDRVVRHLRGQGVAAALVEVGGELSGYGRRPDGSPWRVRVETGDERAWTDPGQACVLALDNVGVATSGGHWHWFEQDGHRYAHTLDPRTGAPVVEAPAAVTVVAASTMQADAWATALTVLGAEAGFVLAEARGIAARFVAARDRNARMTRAFRQWCAA